MKRVASIVIVVAIVGAFAYRFQKAGESVAVESIADVQARRGIPVEVAPVKISTVEIWRAYSGTVEGVRQVSVSADVPEEVVEVTCGVGDRISAGSVVVRLARRKSAARYRQAAAAHQNVKKEVARLEALYQAGAVSESQLDGVRTQLKVAGADLAAASAMVDITTPITGVVVQRDVEVGDTVRPGQPLLVVADVSQAILRLKVSGKDVRRMEVGQLARLLGERVEGTVKKVGLSADPASRLVEVELVFENAGGLLIPGTLATAVVLLDRAQDVPVIPRRAIRQDAGGSTVWVATDDGTAIRRRILAGLFNGTHAEVRQGVQVGEDVVVTGADRLEGSPKINVVRDEAEGDE